MPIRSDRAHDRTRTRDGVARRSWTITVTLATIALAWATPAAHASGVAAQRAADKSAADIGFPKCAWRNISSPLKGNIAFPEGNTTSWIEPFYARSGVIIKVRGQFPYARYMSFTVQPISVADNGSVTFDQTSGDHIYDVNIRPDRGSNNPFKPGTDRATPKRSYSVYIKFQVPDGQAHGNILYGGSAGFVALTYHVYAPDKGRNAQGGVPLPTITKFIYSSAGSKPTVVRVPACAPTPVTGRSLVQQMAATFEQVPALAWHHNVFGLAQSVDPPPTSPSSEGFFDGYHALVTRIVRGAGFYAARFKAPTFADTYDGAPINGREQVRYWSLCEYELSSGHLGGCMADYQANRDSQGFVTIVVSDPNMRARVIGSLHGINWLPLRGNVQGVLIYRQLLAAPTFTQSVEHAPSSAASMQARMGVYYPSFISCALSHWMQNRCR